MDMLDEEDRPHTNEVTFSDSLTITNNEIQYEIHKKFKNINKKPKT